MNEQEGSRLIFEVLSEIQPIETALVSMWSLSNKYARIPFLRFRFKGFTKDDIIYERLKNIIDNYSGKIRWCLTTRDDVLNYILLPEAFEKYLLEHTSIYKEQVLKEFTEKEYNDLIDKAIGDVPSLAKYIRASL
jgi:hypothetical protein